MEKKKNRAPGNFEDNINTCVTGIPQRERQKIKKKIFFEKIMILSEKNSDIHINSRNIWWMVKQQGTILSFDF